jgi:hypothetical protein
MKHRHWPCLRQGGSHSACCPRRQHVTFTDEKFLLYLILASQVALRLASQLGYHSLG